MRSSAARPNGRSSSQAIDRAAAGRRARCCSSPARPGSVRPGSPRRLAAASSRARPARAASSSAVTPYGPVVAALRSYLRAEPGGLDAAGRCAPHLALLLPGAGRAGAGERPRDDLRGPALRARARWPRTAHVAASCSTTCTGRTRSTIELLAALAPAAQGDAGDGPRRLPLRRAAARPHAALAAQRAAPRRRPRGAGPRRRSTASETGELLGELLPGAPSPALVRARARPDPGRPVLRRGDGRRAAGERPARRRARAASTSAATTCRCPTRSATRC